MHIVLIHSRFIPRKKSGGPTFLLDKNNPVILQQTTQFSSYDISVITGFESDKILKIKLGNNVTNIFNEKYMVAGTLYELSLLPNLNDDLLIISGPVILTSKVINLLAQQKYSTVPILPVNPDNELGCVLDQNFNIENILWKLPNKILDVVFLKKKDANELLYLSKKQESINKFLFEGLNFLLEKTQIKGKFIENGITTY